MATFHELRNTIRQAQEAELEHLTHEVAGILLGIFEQDKFVKIGDKRFPLIQVTDEHYKILESMEFVGGRVEGDPSTRSCYLNEMARKVVRRLKEDGYESGVTPKIGDPY